MKSSKAVDILTTAFKALPRPDRDRLEYHRQKGTGICSGKYARWFQYGGRG
ncbi:MAG: hypothetical protein IIA44_06190 [Acidobacteria bacterium]|nr:hypothetical protein [Acidobacteriota bacterium]